MPCFSSKQQHVLIALALLYGVWLLWFGSNDRQHTIVAAQFTSPDPVELPFYIDPPIDVNTAAHEELQLLPGIGPALAGRIIANREQSGQFRSPAALQRVKGIGPKTVSKIRYYLKFQIGK